MAFLIQFLDEAEDFIFRSILSVRRALTWLPRERRHVARLSSVAAQPPVPQGQ